MKVPQLTEYDVYKQLADWMRTAHRDVIYHFDLSGVRLPMGLVAKQKRIQGSRGFPDFFLPKKKMALVGSKLCILYCGLFLEIKRPGTKILTKDGFIVSGSHISEQFNMLASLNRQGYRAEFAVGFDECKQIIDEYLQKQKEETP